MATLRQDIDLDIDPMTIQPGDSINIQWSSANATACNGVGGTGTDGWAVSQSVDDLDGLNVGPLSTAGQYTYELDCTGPGAFGSAIWFERKAAYCSGGRL